MKTSGLHNSVVIALTLSLLAGSPSAFAASKLRLICGDEWDRAGAAVRKTLESEDFTKAADGAYEVECFTESNQAVKENLGSNKLPCIFVLDEQGRCYCVLENVAYNISAPKLVKILDKVNRRRKEIEAKGTDTADQCGELMKAMEKYVGGPKRVIGKAFYGDVFEKLKKLDPTDSTGWQRHFTMGDGLDLVTKANEFRGKKDLAGGEAFCVAEEQKPAGHLTLEQKQAIAMMRFALYRGEKSRDAEMNALLEKIAAQSEDTFWGTAAVGWLNLRKVPPLSVYWGWRKGDFKSPSFSTKIVYGVKHAFRHPGEYTIEFKPDANAELTVKEVTLYMKDEEVVTLKPPFKYTVPKAQAERIDSMRVKGACPAECSGKIEIKRRVLRPRGTAK